MQPNAISKLLHDGNVSASNESSIYDTVPVFVPYGDNGNNVAVNFYQIHGNLDSSTVPVKILNSEFDI